MASAVKLLKKEIIEKIGDLPQKDIKELYDYVIFLEMKSFIPQIDPDQIFFWTKKWQKLENEAEADLKSGRVVGPFKSAGTLIKNLKK